MFNKYSRAFALSLIASLAFAGSAFAQSILVVDSQKVIADSKVGKYVTKQIQSIETSASSEVQAKLKSVQAKAKTFGAQYEGKKQADLVNNAAFKTQYEQLLKDEQKFKQEYAKINQEMQITRQKAIIPVMKKFAEIVKQVGAERNADTVMDRNSVLYVSPTADITQTVLSRLDSQMTTTPVVRERLPNK